MWMSYFEKVVVCFPIVYKMELGNFSFILILVFFSLRAVSLSTQRTRERARKSPRLPLGHLAPSSHRPSPYSRTIPPGRRSRLLAQLSLRLETVRSVRAVA